MGFDVATGFPMVEALIVRFHNDEFNGLLTTDFIIRELIHDSYQRKGPYEFCKRYNLLVNNSAEEFSMQWMAFYNQYVGYQFY